MAVIVGLDQGREKKKRLMLILGIVLLLLVAGGAGITLRLLQNRDAKTNVTTTKGSGFSPEVDDIQALRAKGDLEGANARIEQAFSDPNLPDKARYDLYIQQGNVATDRQDYQAAIVSYQQAEAIEKTYEVTLLLADTWAQAADKAKALEYYKKALLLVPAGPVQEDNKAVIKQLIKNIEAET